MRKIDIIVASEYADVCALWEASVRASHHFLKEEDIEFYRTELQRYLDVVDLVSVRDNDHTILGFMGTADDEIEMLFVHPDEMGKGIGSFLLEYALQTLNKTKVCVNEQNEKGLAFYKKHGFSVLYQSAFDSSGKAYPIMHLGLV